MTVSTLTDNMIFHQVFCTSLSKNNNLVEKDFNICRDCKKDLAKLQEDKDYFETDWGDFICAVCDQKLWNV